MLPVIQRRFDELELIRVKVLGELDRLTPEQLCTIPGANKWRLEEVVEHIIMAEREVLLQPFDPLSKPAKKPGMISQLMLGMVLLVLKANIPVPAPSLEMVPSGRKRLPELCQEWEGLRGCLAGFLQHVTAETMHWQVFFHPIAGMLDVCQTLRLAKFHLLHHARQITEIIALIRKNQSAAACRS